MDKITQDLNYRYSLVKYAHSHGVSKTCRKYNRSRSYVCFWLKRYDGDIRSLGDKSRKPKHHPAEQSPEEIELILRYYQHKQQLGLLAIWFKLKEAGYKRHYVSLYRAMQRQGLIRQKPAEKERPKVKPYGAMQYPGQRVQIDVKHVPGACVRDKT